MFDLKKIREEEVALASKVGSDSSNKEYPYKLLYVQQGTVRVKLLYNPMSDTFKRQVFRHTFGVEASEKVPCLRTWGQDCPICHILRQIESSKGKNVSSMRSIGRGISFVQFVEATYEVRGIEKGDIILLMYPWTIFKDLSMIVSQAKTEEEIASLIASNYGYVIDIVRNKDNSYSAKTNPFGKWKTVNHHSEKEEENPEKIAQEDKEFVELLKTLPSLDEQVLPPEITDEVEKQVMETASSLEDSYLKHRTTPEHPDNVEINSIAADRFNNMEKPEQEKIAETDIPKFAEPSQTPANYDTSVPVTSSVTKPECFSKHGTVDANTCLLCVQEVQCFAATKEAKSKA